MNRVVLVLAYCCLLGMSGVAGASGGTVRAQVDTVGFAVSDEDFQEVLARSLAAENLGLLVDPSPQPAVAVIMPHDDYLYAGRTAVHALPHLQAKRWIIFGVCHACRRIGVRDQLLLDEDDTWLVAGHHFQVDTRLREALARKLGDRAVVSAKRHHTEHSIEALLPWLGAAVDDPLFVPILVPGMELDHLEDLAGELAKILADICRDNNWEPGLDLGLLISADAVHYGCEDWGSGGYSQFGCLENGHLEGRAQDIRISRRHLSGPITSAKIAAFTDIIWDRDHPDYPTYPYNIPWCGLYSIPFGLSVAKGLQEELGKDQLNGQLLRYGDSLSDGRLQVEGTKLGVTAPNTLRHWVGYPTLIYHKPE